MSVTFPRLLDSTGAIIRSIEPASASLDLELAPLSSAELELKPGDNIPERSWVAMYTEHGLAGIFRSKPQRDRYGERSTTVSLVHGAAEINDWLTGKGNQTSSAANTAISSIFNSYGGSMWTLGTVSPTSNVVYELNNSGVLDAIIEIMEQLPGYMITFDQSSVPWVMNIVARPSSVTAEGRLSRNIASVEISRDDSSLCTRVYYGDSGAHVQDTTAVSKYGIIEHKVTESGLTTSQLASIAQAYLDSHKAPKLSVSISAIDLYAATGETLDQITLGSKYRLAIPDAETQENQVIEQIVCSIRYDDIFSGNPQITLASDPDTIINFLRKQRRGGSARQAAIEEADKQYQHWVTENEVYKQSVYKIMGVTYDENGDVIYQTDPVTGEIIYDAAGNPVPVYNELSDGSIAGQVLESATSLETLYTKTGVASLPSGETSLFTYSSKIKQTADSVSSEVTAARDGQPTLSSKITQLSNNISLVVSNGEIDAASIILAINGGTGQSSTTISADKIDLNGLVTATEFQTALASIDTLVGNLEVYGAVTVGGNFLAGSIDTESFSDYKVDGVSIGLGSAYKTISLSGPVNDVYTLTAETFAGNTVTIGNFNRAATSDTNLSGGWSSGKFTVTAQPQNKNYWTEITQGTASWSGAQVTIPIMATDSTSGGNSYATGRNVFLDCSSITGAITNISGTALTQDQTLTTVPIKASGTNVNDYTENATLTNTTYTDGGVTYPCVNLLLDSSVIGRISTVSTYNNGWGAAVAQLDPPDQYTGSGEQLTFSVGIPSSTVGGSSSYNFTLDKQTASSSGYAYVLCDNTLVGRISVGNYYTSGQDSVAATFGTYSGTPGSTPQELSPGTYEFKIVKGSTTTTDTFYTVPSAPTPADPKVSRSSWSNGQITMTAGTTGKSVDTVKILSATQQGTLNQAGDLISFNVYEELTGDSEQATGAVISAAIVKGTATPATPVWQGDSTHKYNISATGSFTVGGQTISQNTGSISGGFEPTDAINYGKKVATESLTVSQTSQPEYSGSTASPVSITSGGYYFVSIGNTAVKKFQAPSGGAGTPRNATSIAPITLTAGDTSTSMHTSAATYNDGHTDDPGITQVQIDAHLVYEAGVAAGSGGVAVDVVKGEWNKTYTDSGSTIEFSPSIPGGQTQTLTIRPVPVSSSGTSGTGQIAIKDGDSSIITSMLKMVYDSSDSTVKLQYGPNIVSLLTDPTIIGSLPVEGGGGGSSTVESIVQSGNIEYTDTTKKQAIIPVSALDDGGNTLLASVISVDVHESYDQGYTEGLVEGSRLNIETPHIESTPITTNGWKTINPSYNYGVMTAAQFEVRVPTDVQIAEIGLSTDNEATYNSWTYDNIDSLSKKYCRVKVTPAAGEDYYLKINAEAVYNAGVTAGSGYSVMGVKSYGTVRSSGSYTISPDNGYDAMTGATFYVDVPRVQDSVSQTITAPGTTTVTPTGQYGAMKKALITVPSISVNTEKNAYVPAGTSVTSIRIGENQKVTVKFGTTTMATLYFKAVQ